MRHTYKVTKQSSMTTPREQEEAEDIFKKLSHKDNNALKRVQFSEAHISGKK